MFFVAVLLPIERRILVGERPWFALPSRPDLGVLMSEWFVVCLCAGWCGVCKEYSAGFRALAARHPEAAFHWVDIEDEADVIGDVDVETFPTLLIACGADVHHFGALPPQPEVLARLLSGFQAESGRVPSADAEAKALWRRVSAVLGSDTVCTDLA